MCVKMELRTKMLDAILLGLFLTSTSPPVIDLGGVCLGLFTRLRAPG